MIWLHSHTSVTPDDIVTVMVTSHEIIEKNVDVITQNP